MFTSRANPRFIIGLVSALSALAALGMIGRQHWSESQNVAGVCLELAIDQVQLRQDLLDNLRQDVRAQLRKHKIGTVGTGITKSGAVKIRLGRQRDTDVTIRALQSSSPKTVRGKPHVIVARDGHDITVTPTQAAIEERLASAMEGSIQHIKSRLISDRATALKVVKVEAIDKMRLKVEITTQALWHSLRRSMHSSPPRVSVHYIRPAGNPGEVDQRSRIFPDRFNPARTYRLDRRPIFTNFLILGVEISRGRTDATELALRLGASASQQVNASVRTNLNRPLALLIDSRVFAVSTIQSQRQYGFLRFPIEAEQANSSQIIPLIRLSLGLAKLNIISEGACS
jgi:preprotein translocase subunit SecD